MTNVKYRKNARKEFITHIGNRKVICATIDFGSTSSNVTANILTTGWDSEDWKVFLDSIDVEYDSGYGTQELYGTIWYEDGTWSERCEYDGSEWWLHQECPDIPDNLIRIDKVRNNKINELGI
jgi:hypothetical protein